MKKCFKIKENKTSKHISIIFFNRIFQIIKYNHTRGCFICYWYHELCKIMQVLYVKKHCGHFSHLESEFSWNQHEVVIRGRLQQFFMHAYTYMIFELLMLNLRCSCNHSSHWLSYDCVLCSYSGWHSVVFQLHCVMLPLSHWESNLLRQAAFPCVPSDTGGSQGGSARQGCCLLHSTHAAKFSCLLSVPASGDRQHTWGWAGRSYTTFLNHSL